jgi:plasmid stability protein
MGQLLVRNLDDELVRLLKIRAAEHGHSMEAEHRKILQEVLMNKEEGEMIPSFKSLLLEMPEFSVDELQRSEDYGREIEW